MKYKKNTLKFLGQTWKIKKKSMDSYGRCDYENKTIFFDSEKDFDLEVLIHELSHAFFIRFYDDESEVSACLLTEFIIEVLPQLGKNIILEKKTNLKTKNKGKGIALLMRRK